MVGEIKCSTLNPSLFCILQPGIRKKENLILFKDKLKLDFTM